MSIEKIDVAEKPGVQQFNVQPGVHTIIVDTTVIYKLAISEFIHKLSEWSSKNTSSIIAEDIALAIGWFDVPLDMIYKPEKYVDGGPSSIADLDDDVLAAIVRLRMQREQDASKT
jgi:hypothetical protein